MSAMSAVEAAFCRSAPWRGFARRVVLPWALDGTAVEGDVLEIGGGSGAMAEALLDRHPGLRLTVTDIDPGMTSRMRRRFDRFGDRCSVQEADVLDLPHPDGSFDVVLSFLMLHHVLEWETALREAHRVLRPGGLLLGYDLVHAPIAPRPSTASTDPRTASTRQLRWVGPCPAPGSPRLRWAPGCSDR
jgi:ubiquinone/menaquinone biosynthesis C-methylase UbiE